MTEPPSGGFQSGGRLDKTGIAYRQDRRALFEPGKATDFFAHQPQTLEALCAELARLAYHEGGAASLAGYLARVGLELDAAPL